MKCKLTQRTFEISGQDLTKILKSKRFNSDFEKDFMRLHTAEREIKDNEYADKIKSYALLYTTLCKFVFLSAPTDRGFDLFLKYMKVSMNKKKFIVNCPFEVKGSCGLKNDCPEYCKQYKKNSFLR